MDVDPTIAANHSAAEERARLLEQVMPAARSWRCMRLKRCRVFASNRFSSSIVMLNRYGKEYTRSSSWWHQSIGLDDSPLYWRGYYTPYDLHSFLPEARIVFFFRDPLSRALSSYRYFCLQEKGAECTSEEFLERIQQTIVFFRYHICQGNLGVSATSEQHPKCKEFNEVDTYANVSGYRRWRVKAEDLADVWPANDPEMMLNWWSFWGQMSEADHVHKGAILEGIYWPRLLEWLGVWPEENVLNFISNDFDQDTQQCIRDALEFYGVPDPNFILKETNGILNIAEKSNRHSNRAKILPEAKRLLQDIFIPHLMKHAQILEDLIQRRPLPTIPKYKLGKRFPWIPKTRKPNEEDIAFWQNKDMDEE